ncbi:lytic transglycosylase domain-containing protein [Streptomyces sp. G45]|uniref:lytic transglycosylase domain-containing protein n=1 Tax=Streptomyces sp. G45 TaxID=3406627 RepID=UPI003C1D105A
MAPVFGKRLRKATVTSAVAAAAVAALAASQAPGVATPDKAPGGQAADASQPPAPDSATGNSPYYTDLPPLKTPPPPNTEPGGGAAKGDPEAGLPATVLDAYKKAEAAVRSERPGCNLPWQLLAAIGKVESGQARGGRVDADGTTLTPILGPVLDGNGFAKITDTDGGAYDGDTTHDRAVGPMQFIPSTWKTSGQDGNGDGKKDPNNIYDAALAAAHYLCGKDRDLAVEDDLHAAILSYNQSTEYLNTVLSWLEYYRKGTHEIPDGTGVLPDDRNRSDDRDDRGDRTPRPGSSARPPSHRPSPSTPPKPLPRPQQPDKLPPDETTRPGTPGGGSGKPTPKPPQQPQDQVKRLKNTGPDEVTATAGDAFDERVAVRAEDRSGKGVAKVKVRFTISGDTDTRFAGGARSVTLSTDGTGTVTSPELRAGEKTGAFTVRALVVGRSLDRVEVPGTVTGRKADALARIGDEPLTCAPGKAFAEQVQVKATYKGDSAAGVAATATMITSATRPTVNDKGPYFKDADGKPVRVLKGLRTDKNGKLLLPKMYADDKTGTYLLRIVTDGGATLTVELKVTADKPTETPSGTPSTTPSGTPSGTPSSTPSSTPSGTSSTPPRR